MTALVNDIGAAASDAAKAPTYILNGYSFGKIPGVNVAELQAKLKHKEGDRITEADVAADRDIVAKELEERNIKGQLFASTAEKNGRVWVIFDLQQQQIDKTQIRYLESQSFEGASHISNDALAAATHLHIGAQLSLEQVRAARQAILAAYAKVMPGKTVALKAKMQTTIEGKVRLTWIIGEPN